MSNNEKQKDIFNLSNKELRDITKDGGRKTEDIRHILESGIRDMKYEIERIERFLGNFTNQGAALMTVSGLISLLPFGLANNATEFLSFYMTWIFPFLIFAIFAFTRSVGRANTYKIKFTSVPKGSEDELIVLRMEAKGIQDIWQQIYKQHKKTLVWYRLNNISVVLFLFWYILNFYFFTFLALPDNNSVILPISLLILCGVIMYLRNLLLSFKKGWAEKAVGGIPKKDEQNPRIEETPKRD